jgi:nucleoside-diphosphate-sugar epimerase
MKVLLTGVTGYIAKRLLPVLLENGFEVVCCDRFSSRFNLKRYSSPNISVIDTDFFK